MNTRATTRQLFDIRLLERESDRLAKEFFSADPFPHVVVDGLIGITPSEADSFPQVGWDRWATFGDANAHNKRACNDIDAIPDPFKSLIQELSKPRFLRCLEKITGVRQLLPDPYLTGGGLHLSGPGGILSEHIDFHYYRALNLYRRVNVLLYFNEEWFAEDGGCLSLFDTKHRPVQTVVPKFGRMVAFATDDKSLHGFPVPVVEGRWRRSVALYYYTAAEAPNYSGDETTYFRGLRPKGLTGRGRHVVYRGLINLSRAISVLAHLVNPAQGLGLFRTILANRRRAAQRQAELSTKANQ